MSGSRQSAAAKAAWASGRSRIGQPGFVDLERSPTILRSLDMHLPEACQAILLGGGAGRLGSELSNGSRRFVSLDIAVPHEAPSVPLLLADMEVPLPLGRRRPAGLPRAVVAAFSIEYTDLARSLSNVAEALLAGERFVWLSHHARSPIVDDLRVGRQLADLVSRSLAAALDAATADYAALAADAEAAAESLPLSREGGRRADLRILLEELRAAADAPGSESTSLARIAELANRLTREAEAARLLVEQCPASADDLALLARPFFRPLLGGPVVVEGHPVGLLAVFDRASPIAC